MVALPGGTTASAKLWLLAFPDGVPASSRIEEPSAVMKALRCSRRTMSIERRLVSRCGRGLHWCGSLALARKAALTEYAREGGSYAPVLPDGQSGSRSVFDLERTPGRNGGRTPPRVARGSAREAPG